MNIIKKTGFLILFACSILQVVAQQKEYKIGILMDSKTAVEEALIAQFQSQVKATVGEDAAIDISESNILVNGFDLDMAKQQYQSLVANDTDMIIALGVVTTEMLKNRNTYPKPTIMVGAINEDMQVFDFGKKTSGTPNLTYILEQASFKKDIEAFKGLYDFNHLGILIEEAAIALMPLEATFSRILEGTGTTFSFIPLEKMDGNAGILDTVDAVYLAGGYVLSETSIKTLSKKLIAKKLPSFTINARNYVDSGLMATRNTGDNFNQIIRRLAIIIDRHVNGDALADIPLLLSSTSGLVINYNTAEAVGIPIKYSLAHTAEFTGEFKYATPEETYSLVDAINKALGKNLQLQSLQKGVELSTQDIRTAKNNYLPEVVASTNATHFDPDFAQLGFGQTPEFQTSGSLTLDQTIFSAEASANIFIQKNLQKVQEERFNAEELNTIFQVSQAYLNILILKSNAEILRTNLNISRQNYSIAQENFNAGAAGKSDMLRFKSEIAQNTQALIEALNQIDQGYITLNELLNNPVNKKVDIQNMSLDAEVFSMVQYEDLTQLLDSPETRNPFIDFLTELAIENAPELKAIEYNLKATDKALKLSTAGRFLPTIGLRAQYNNVFNRSGEGSEAFEGFTLPDDNYNVGITMSIPIFNRNQTNTNQQIARIQKDQLELNRDNNKLSISGNVNRSILNVINQTNNIKLSEVSKIAAEEALDLTQTSYKTGVVNIVQLLDAQSNYINAQLAETTAAYSYLMSLLEVERAIGHFFTVNTNATNASFLSKFLEFQNK